MHLRDTLLLVNDNRDSRTHLQAAFEKKYNLLEAENGVQALMLMTHNHSCLAAVILDTHMPIMDGFQVMEELAQTGLLSDLPVIIVSDDNIADSEAKLFDMGASDVIYPPYDLQVVQRRVQNIVDMNRKRWYMEGLLEKQARHPHHASEEIVDALTSAMETNRPEVKSHAPRIRRCTQILLEEVALSCPEYGLTPDSIDLISSAATFHDIGKLLVPDSILTKPDRLSPEERAVVQTHTSAGCLILENVKLTGAPEYLQYARTICRHHHERWDGAGYPDGLKGDDIPLCAQVVGLVDAYDALTSQQFYRPAHPHNTAMNLILNGECGCFSPKLLECLKAVSDQFTNITNSDEDILPSVASPDLQPPAAPTSTEHSDTLQNTQLKYQALLSFLDATVMEADLDNMYYHLIYNSDPCFASLAGSSSPPDIPSLLRQIFVEEDAEGVYRKIVSEFRTFFRDGLRIHSFSQELCTSFSRQKMLYKFTFLRIEPDDSSRRRLIIICQPDTACTSSQYSDMASETALLPEAQRLLAGVCRFRNDLCLTFANSCFPLVELLGYSESELESRFQNRLMNLVIPEDRQILRRNMKEQLSCGRNTNLEFRLLHKDGHHVWVLSRGYLIQSPEGELLSCILMDITQTKQDLELLRLSLERYQIITAQTDDIIFEWDLSTDSVECTNKWQALFGYAPISDNISARIAVASHFHPEDVQNFVERMAALQNGADYQDAEVRIAKSDGRYLWCQVRATAQYNADGTPRKVVGVIINIDAEKRATQALQSKAEQDALTKLLNKNTSQKQVEQHLTNRPSDHPAALMILDLDNFKQVNDRHGHLFGDTILTLTASVIRKFFRAEDVIARIGGDEFMVYMSNIPSLAALNQRCSDLVKAFQTLFLERCPDCEVSCSIGVALVPDHGTTFRELFQRADMALYRAKANGKNGYKFYDAAEHSFLPFSESMDSRTAIDSDVHEVTSHNDLLQHAFRCLYESTDLEKTIPSILAMVGIHLNVSRVYIFENSPDNKTCSNTFQWCNSNIPPEQADLQNLSYETDIPDYEDNFAANGVFYSADISTLPQHLYNLLASYCIKATLQCAIRDNGQFRGFIGFDDCNGNRLWTQDQISLLISLSELFSVFLPKKRAQDGLNPDN